MSVWDDQVSSEGGRMTAVDLSEYSALSTDPVSSSFRGNASFFASSFSQTSLLYRVKNALVLIIINVK